MAVFFCICLTLKAPITTAADDIHKYFSLFFFSEKIRLDISSESSARQRIHMKNQALFSSTDKSKEKLTICIYCYKGRAVTNVGRTCSPTLL